MEFDALERAYLSRVAEGLAHCAHGGGADCRPKKITLKSRRVPCLRYTHDEARQARDCNNIRLQDGTRQCMRQRQDKHSEIGCPAIASPGATARPNLKRQVNNDDETGQQLISSAASRRTSLSLSFPRNSIHLAHRYSRTT